MFKRVEDPDQLEVCVFIIQQSFKTVAQEFHLTKENCPGHTSFMTIEKIKKQFDAKRLMFLYVTGNKYVGYFSLNKRGEKSYELDNLAVLPNYRNLGIGKAMVQYAKKFVSDTYNGNQLKIGIIEENIVLKEWYQELVYLSLFRQASH
jgi:ribosomal protein S18 acetylase RimI-like enzyme